MMHNAQKWADMDPNPETKKELQDLIDKGDEAEISKRMGSRLAFGTAGLRGPMKAGSAAMNDLVVIQATQGLCAYLEKTFPAETKERGVCIGFDHRRMGTLSSRSFGFYAAAVFLSKNIPVYFYPDICPTPLVPFCVTNKNCLAGIMVTASHNPREDDGYKVYWGNGCQIIPPVDSDIAAAIEENLAPWHVYDIKAVAEHELFHDIYDEVSEAYIKAVSEKFCFHAEDNSASPVPIVYTAMHGVGAKFVERMFHAFGHRPYVPVAEQVEPNPDFPTVRFPNPEESGALDMGQKVAEEADATVVIANDPDADRLAASERQPDGSWYLLNGNQLGTLFADWAWKKYKFANPDSPRGAGMCASTVSSKMLGRMGEVEGFEFHETLTGFKWLGNKMLEMKAEGKDALFCYEEAIGFCVGDVVVDKDGVSGAAIFSEMVKQLYKAGKTLKSHLWDLYEKYGFFITLNSYCICRDPAVTDRIFARLYNDGKYWETCGPYTITEVRDLRAPGYDSSTADKKPLLPVSGGSYMLTFKFSNGCLITLRTSGTEPKIKYYCELRGADEAATREELSKQVEVIVKEMLQPEENGLERAK